MLDWPLHVYDGRDELSNESLTTTHLDRRAAEPDYRATAGRTTAADHRRSQQPL